MQCMHRSVSVHLKYQVLVAFFYLLLEEFVFSTRIEENVARVLSRKIVVDVRCFIASLKHGYLEGKNSK